jgi:hypothetical protein
LLLSTLAIAAFAEDPKPLPPTPAGFPFAGAWACEGADVHKARFTGAVILEGTWLELTEEDVQPATGYRAKYLIGFDAERRVLVEFDANNFSAATYTSERGWDHGVLTMTSPVSTDPKAPYVANRFRYDASSGKTFVVDWQIRKTATSPWADADHLLCRHA